MSDLVQNVINQALQDGARPAKFKCQIVFPSAFARDKKDDVMLDAICKGASFDGKTNETINLMYKGRTIPVPGQEKFSQTIAITLYLEENHATKNLFYDWMIGMNYESYNEDSKNNLSAQALQKEKVNMAYGKIILTQLDFDNNKELVEYTFHNVFPKEFDAIALNAETISSISEYACSFSYTYYTIATKNQTNSNDVANNILTSAQDAVNSIVQSAMGFIPGYDSIDTKASKLNTDIKELGKSIGSTASEWLG